MADNRISEIIQNQLPAFFQEEGSNLPLFMTKYFEFLESYQIEYTDLELDEYNIVQEDDDGAYYVVGTALDQRNFIYEPSDDADSTEAGMKFGHYYPVYGNKAPALAASDDATVYELELEELKGLIFYIPKKGGANGGNYGIAIKDPPSSSYTQYSAASRVVKEDSPASDPITFSDGLVNTEIIVESERGTDATFAIGEVIVGSKSGSKCLVTGVQAKDYAAGKYLETANTTSPNYNLSPHLLFARPINGIVLMHGESIRGRSTRAKATVGKTDKDLLRNPLRGAADIDLMTDIDAADNYMLQQFREDFLQNIPFSSVGDLRQAVKTARDIYRSRGTEDSFLWLWRTVYGSDQLSFVYPKERLLRPSDGTWSSSKSIKVYTGTALNPDDFNSRVIKGELSQASATIDNSISYVEGSTAVTELYLTDYVKGYDARFDIYSDFQPGETVATIEAYVDVTESTIDELMGSDSSSAPVKAMTFPETSSRGTCIAVIGEIDIVSNGTAYKVNDELIITGGAGKGAVARVGATANGAIDEIIIDDGGNGYMGGEVLIVDSTGTLGTNHTGAVRGVLETGKFRTSNSVINKVISTANGGLASSAISLNAFSFSVDDPGDVRYPENINTHFSSSNTTTWVAEVINQDTTDGGANILLEEGDGKLVFDSTTSCGGSPCADGTNDAGDNILLATKAFEDDIQPGFYIYDSKTGTKGTIAGPSINSSCFVYVIENDISPNFVQNSYGDLYYSANTTAVPGKSSLFQIDSIKPASYYEIEGNQLGDNTYSIDSYYGATEYTFTPFGAISNVQVITTGIDYIKGPSYEASNQTILGKKSYEFEDPITGKNTAALAYLNFGEDVAGKYKFGEYIIGQSSGKKVQVIQPIVNSTANSTFSTMKVKEVDTQFSLEDENVLLNNIGTFENNTSGLYSFSTKRKGVPVGGTVTIVSNGNESWTDSVLDTGNNTLSIESSNTIYGSYSGKIAVNDQLETYVGLKGLNNSTGEAYEGILKPGDQYIGKLSFRASKVLNNVILKYGSAATDVNFESDGPTGGLTQVKLYKDVATTNKDQVYTYEGKFTVHPTDSFHSLFLYVNTTISTSYDLHVDNVEIVDITSRGKIEYEGFNTADEPEIFMVMEPQTDFTAGETVISLSGARTAAIASSNVKTYEAISNYGNNAVLRSGALKTGAIKSIVISQAGINYTTVPVVTAPTGDNNATFTAKRTTITNYPGTFKSKLGMISDIIRVQDSYYYQDFSYVLRSDIQISEFRDMVRSFVHPAGWNVFGEIGIESFIGMTVDVSSATEKIMELFIDRTPSYISKFGPIDKDMRQGYNRNMMPFDSVDGLINFDVSIIHNYHIEFLDPLSIGFGSDTSKTNFAFHLGRVDDTTWLNGLGWDYEKEYRGDLQGQFGPAANTPYYQSDAGRVEIQHNFLEHDQTNNLNESTKIAPWYPNVIAEYVIPGHYEGNECTGHSVGGGVSAWGKSTHYNTENRWAPVHVPAAAGGHAGAQRPPDTPWGMGNNPDLLRKGGTDYWLEIGILGKYRSPDGQYVMPTITTYVSYGEETIELVGDATISVLSWKEPTLPIRMATASLPNLTGVTTYIDTEMFLPIEMFNQRVISRSAIEYPNSASREITVTVSGSDYYFDGVNINNSAWTRNLIKGVTYRFWQEDSSNSGHPLRFASVLDGDHNASWVSSMEFPSTAVGTPGVGGSYVDFKIPDYIVKTYEWSTGTGIAEDVLFAYCDVHSDYGGPIKTEDKVVVRPVSEGPVRVTSVVNTPDTDTRGTYRQPTFEYGQSYARPKDKRLNNPLRTDNLFEVAVAKVWAGQVVGLRTDGTIQQVYQTASVCFPRINYVHSLLGIVEQDGAVGEFVEVRDTDSTAERVYDLNPGEVYYPNYSATPDEGIERWITTVAPTITSADSLDRIKLGRASTQNQLELSFPQWKLHIYQANEDLPQGAVVGLMSNGKVQKVFCEVDGTPKPQLDGVHSLLGVVKDDGGVDSGDWVEIITKDQTLEMDTFYQGAETNFTWATDTTLYVDYRDGSVKLNVAYSNHPLNIIGKTLGGQQGTEQTLIVTANTPVHGTYSPTWDKVKYSWPWRTYCPVSTVPRIGDMYDYDEVGEYAGLGLELTFLQNPTPVENIVSGSTILFDDINIILEEEDGMLLEDGDELLVEDGTSTATSTMGKLKIENDYLLYENLINTGSDYRERINIYSKFDAKYIVGNYTTQTFNVHERANKYFPEGRIDGVAQHVLE
jgi:hypothetical protein